MTNNTGRTTVAASQNDKYVTINDSDGRLDAALTSILESDYTSADETLSDDEFQQAMCFRSTNLSTARVLTIPDSIPKLFTVDNSAGSDTLTVTKNSTTSVVAAGETGVFYTDGTTDDLVLFTAASTTLTYPFGKKGSDLASASTLDASSGTTGNYRDVTGTTTITAISNLGAGEELELQFDSTPTLQHNGTSFILPTADDIVCEAGDVARFRGEGSGNVRCVSYQRKSGRPLDYEAGTFTPGFDRETTGDLSNSYAEQSGHYVKIGGMVQVHTDMSSTPTYSTASGACIINNLPFVLASAANNNPPFGVLQLVSSCNWDGATQVLVGIFGAVSEMGMLGAASGANQIVLGDTTFPSGAGRSYRANLVYPTDS